MSVSEESIGNLASFCGFLVELPEGSGEERLTSLVHKTQVQVTPLP